MKIKIVLLSAISSFVVFSAFAQAVENDDMYFNKKDRAKLDAEKAAIEKTYVSYEKSNDSYKSSEPVYASIADYSSRNVNPEYAARSNAQEAQFDDQDYFLANYQFNNAPANNLNQFNNNWNNWYNNPMYNSTYMGVGINTWNGSYYGMNNPYNSPWYDPFYSNNGFSSSFSYYSGGSYNYGWGGNYNFRNQPYYGGSSWGNGYGSPWGYNNYGYGNYGNNYGYSPNVIIVNTGDSRGRGVTYGKRPTSSGGVVSSAQANGVRTRSNTVTNDGNSGSGRSSYTGGRTSSSSTQQSAYYNRSWRDAQQTQTNFSNQPTRNWGGNTQQNNPSDFNRSNSGNRSNSFDNGGNSGGGTRTHSSTPSSSGSNGRTRGRD